MFCRFKYDIDITVVFFKQRFTCAMFLSALRAFSRSHDSEGQRRTFAGGTVTRQRLVSQVTVKTNCIVYYNHYNKDSRFVLLNEIISTLSFLKTH